MTDLLAEQDAARLALRCLDLTNLNDDCDDAAIRALAERARRSSRQREGAGSTLAATVRFCQEKNVSECAPFAPKQPIGTRVRVRKC